MRQIYFRFARTLLGSLWRSSKFLSPLGCTSFHSPLSHLTYLFSVLVLGYNECWTRPHALSVAHGNMITVWRISCTMSFTGLTFRIELSTSWVCWCTYASTTKHLGTWWTTARQSLTSSSNSVCVRPAVTNFPCHVIGSAPTAVGRFCCRTNCLELIAWRPTWSGMFPRHFQTVAKDVFVFTVLVCTAH